MTGEGGVTKRAPWIVRSKPGRTVLGAMNKYVLKRRNYFLSYDVVVSNVITSCLKMDNTLQMFQRCIIHVIGLYYFFIETGKVRCILYCIK